MIKNKAVAKDEKAFFELFLYLKTFQEVESFLRDLCTPQEIQAMIDRWKICQLLDQGQLSYRDISQETGASLATITRVARFMKDEPYQGYQLMLQRTQKNKRRV